MNLQRLFSFTRQAIDEYHMIQDGDHIAVGISGGKDSLTLLYALHGLMQFYTKRFTITAVTVDLGFDSFDLHPVEQLCAQLSVPYQIFDSNIGKIVFETRKESNPCALCAKMRKGLLNKEAKALGCNKIAYAHHKDDSIETMLLSLIYEGRFHTFTPCTYLNRADITVIRPLIFVPEADIVRFKEQYQLPVCKNPCPADGHTKREMIKLLVKGLEQENPGSTNNLYHALKEGIWKNQSIKEGSFHEYPTLL